MSTGEDEGMAETEISSITLKDGICLKDKAVITERNIHTHTQSQPPKCPSDNTFSLHTRM